MLQLLHLIEFDVIVFSVCIFVPFDGCAEFSFGSGVHTFALADMSLGMKFLVIELVQLKAMVRHN